MSKTVLVRISFSTNKYCHIDRLVSIGIFVRLYRMNYRHTRLWTINVVYVYIRLIRLGYFKNMFEPNTLFLFKFSRHYIHFSITIIITNID